MSKLQTRASSRREGDDEAYQPLVWVAEDDVELRDQICSAFSAGSYRIQTFVSGLQLYDALRGVRQGDDPPAIVITDLHLPGMSGLTALRVIRDWGWSLPVVLISAVTDQATVAEAFRMEAHAVFARPFDIEDLYTVVVSLLPRRRLEPNETAVSCACCGQPHLLPKPIADPMIFFCRPCFSVWTNSNWRVRSQS